MLNIWHRSSSTFSSVTVLPSSPSGFFCSPQTPSGFFCPPQTPAPSSLEAICLSETLAFLFTFSSRTSSIIGLPGFTVFPGLSTDDGSTMTSDEPFAPGISVGFSPGGLFETGISGFSSLIAGLEVGLKPRMSEAMPRSSEWSSLILDSDILSRLWELSPIFTPVKAEIPFEVISRVFFSNSLSFSRTLIEFKAFDSNTFLAVR
mmetsp:Transcript_31918/g.51331  ORF Transcript_31918/g.51331 Transcript_31918/m.51331 type:complete len:204 (+) Transcript_31918:1091-1702(+)